MIVMDILKERYNEEERTNAGNAHNPRRRQVKWKFTSF
jgi:hypothetical protein